MHELVIRGGTVVDGTGTSRCTADVAVDDGKISAVGRVGAGHREIDLAKCVLANALAIDLAKWCSQPRSNQGRSRAVWW